jgi:DNA-binding helix-hairpin-helix protein with protein kinase domain
MLIFDETGRSWGLGKKIASGGEGVVHRLLDSSDYCAKVYHAVPMPPRKQAKLAALRSLPAAARQNAAIPVSLAFARPGDPIAHSVILPLVTGHDIYELYNPQGRSEHFRRATFEFLVAAAKNVATAFQSLHEHGVVIGDVNEQNIKVRTDATVRIIDCDSFQFSHAGVLYTSDVGTPIWTPPELQGCSVQGLARSTNHDAFGLAQLIFLLLFAGRYPYAGRPLTNTQLSPEEAISRYAFAYAPPHKNQLLAPPPGAPSFDTLPEQMRALFVRAFAEGFAASGGRPTPGEWVVALQQLAENLTACPGSRQHVYWKGATGCPWCAVMRAVKADLFPGLAGRVEEISAAIQEHLVFATRLLELAFHPLEFVEPSPIAVATFLSNRTQPRQRRPLLAAALRFVGLSSSPAKTTDALHLELHDLEQRLLKLRRLGDALTRQHRAACSPFLQKATALAANLKDVPALRSGALEQLRDNHRALAMERHLEGFLLRRVKISGIGETRMSALLSAGITTAADVREDHIRAVPWIGTSCAAKLLAWRQECEAQFKFDASGALPEALRSKVNALVGRSIEALVQKGRQLEQDYHQAVASYANEFGKLQQEFETLWKQRAAVQGELEILGGQ